MLVHLLTSKCHAQTILDVKQQLDQLFLARFRFLLLLLKETPIHHPPPHPSSSRDLRIPLVLFRPFPHYLHITLTLLIHSVLATGIRGRVHVGGSTWKAKCVSRQCAMRALATCNSSITRFTFSTIRITLLTWARAHSLCGTILSAIAQIFLTFAHITIASMIIQITLLIFSLTTLIVTHILIGIRITAISTTLTSAPITMIFAIMVACTIQVTDMTLRVNCMIIFKGLLIAMTLTLWGWHQKRLEMRHPVSNNLFEPSKLNRFRCNLGNAVQGVASCITQGCN